MLSRWPVRHPRGATSRLGLDTPFVSGQRSIDTLFPPDQGAKNFAAMTSLHPRVPLKMIREIYSNTRHLSRWRYERPVTPWLWGTAETPVG